MLLCNIDLESEKVSQVNLSNTHDGLVMTGYPEAESFLTAVYTSWHLYKKVVQLAVHHAALLSHSTQEL